MSRYRHPTEADLINRATGADHPAPETMRQVHASIKTNASRQMLQQSLALVGSCALFMAVCLGGQLLGDAIQGIGQSAPNTGPSRSQ